MTLFCFSLDHAPRQVKRIIVRSATETAVDKLKSGKFTLYKGEEIAETEFTLAAEDTCIVYINYANAVEATKAIASQADKIRMDITGVHRETKGRTGFKLDIFLDEITMEVPDSNTPGTSSNSTTT